MRPRWTRQEFRKSGGFWLCAIALRGRARRPSGARCRLDGTSSFYGPARYQAMVLRDEDPTQVKVAGAGSRCRLEDLTVWPPLYRRAHSVRTMVQDHLRKKAEQAVLAERRAWEKVNIARRLGALPR